MDQFAPALLSEQGRSKPLAATFAASNPSQLSAEQVREMCVVPVAFVSDHVETLGEIDHEARHEAYMLGIHAIRNERRAE